MIFRSLFGEIIFIQKKFGFSEGIFLIMDVLKFEIFCFLKIEIIILGSIFIRLLEHECIRE